MQKFRACAAIAVLALVPIEAQAAELTIKSEYEPEDRPQQLDIVVAVQARSLAGIFPGLFYAYPIVPQGFISTLNDAFYIEGGVIAGAFFDPTFFWFAPQAGVRWVFYLTQAWAVFGAVRVGAGIEFVDYIRDNYTWPYLSVTVGAHWHFSDVVALRLEAGGGLFGGQFLVGISFQL